MKNWRLWTGWTLIALPITAMFGLMAMLSANVMKADPLETVSKWDRWTGLVSMAFASYIPMAIGARLVTEHYYGKKEIVSIK